MSNVGLAIVVTGGAFALLVKGGQCVQLRWDFGLELTSVSDQGHVLLGQLEGVVSLEQMNVIPE